MWTFARIQTLIGFPQRESVVFYLFICECSNKKKLELEAKALGCKYSFLISSISLTRSPVSFNFTHLTDPKMLPLHSFDNLNTEGMF